MSDIDYHQDGNDYQLCVLQMEDMPAILRMRQERAAMLRTPYLLTLEMQQDFYKNVVCNRQSNARFFAIRLTSGRAGDSFCGMIGVENIQWENGTGEISCLLFNPRNEMVDDLLCFAFREMNLHSIIGECYECSPDYIFWKDYIARIGCYNTVLPDRKFHMGQYFPALWFAITETDFAALRLP